MINYNTQIRHLSDAQESIQNAINECKNSITKGKMYITIDLIKLQIDVIMDQQEKQSMEIDAENTAWDAMSDELVYTEKS